MARDVRGGAGRTPSRELEKSQQLSVRVHADGEHNVNIQTRSVETKGDSDEGERALRRHDAGRASD